MTFKTSLKVVVSQTYHKQCYIPKCLSYSEVYETTVMQLLMLLRAEISNMAPINIVVHDTKVKYRAQ